MMQKNTSEAGQIGRPDIEQATLSCQKARHVRVCLETRQTQVSLETGQARVCLETRQTQASLSMGQIETQGTGAS